MKLDADTVLYLPAKGRHPGWRTTVREVIETSTAQFSVQKEMGLAPGLTLVDVADRLTVKQLQVLANDWRVVVCG